MSLKNARIATAIFIAALAAGCGGGGGGGGDKGGTPSTGTPGTNTPAATVTITPVPVAASATAGDSFTAVLEGTWQAGNLPAGGAVYLKVNDPTGTFANPAIQPAPTPGTFRYDLAPKGLVLSGDHTGQIEITACRDANCAQTWGPAVRVDFKLSIKTLGEWETLNRDAAHASFVPTTLDPTRLRVVWEWDAPEVGGTLERYIGRPTTTNGSLVLVAGGNASDGTQRNAMFAFDESDGSQRWSRRIPDGVAAVAPASNGELAYLATLGTDTLITALDGKSGAPAFTYAQVTQPLAVVLAPTHDRGQLFFFAGFNGEELHAVDARTGARLWSSPRSLLQSATPTVDSTYVYYQAGNEIALVSKRTGAYVDSIWDMDSNGAILPGSTTVALGTRNNLIARTYHPLRGQRLSSFDVPSRTKQWITTAPYGGFYAVGNGSVYASRSGQAFATIDALDEATARIQWSWSPPVADNQTRVLNNVLATRNMVFVSTEDATTGRSYVWAIDAATGQTAWRQEEGGYLVMSGNRTLYVVSRRGTQMDHVRALRVQ